ncbi:MAG: helix-turn-helix domain-containing protein [Nitrosospira sp.]
MTKKPISQDWQRWHIIGAVRNTGTNLSQLSIKLGYSEITLRNALYHPAPKYERLIAEHLGTTPQVIWPSRYHEDGSARSGRGERGIGRYKSKKNGNTVKKSRNVYQLNRQEAT